MKTRFGDYFRVPRNAKTRYYVVPVTKEKKHSNSLFSYMAFEEARQTGLNMFHLYVIYTYSERGHSGL
jgi:hypothetical protein